MSINPERSIINFNNNKCNNMDTEIDHILNDSPKKASNNMKARKVRIKTDRENSFLEAQFLSDPSWNRKTVQYWKKNLNLKTHQIYKWGFDKKISSKILSKDGEKIEHKRKQNKYIKDYNIHKGSIQYKIDIEATSKVDLDICMTKESSKNSQLLTEIDYNYIVQNLDFEVKSSVNFMDKDWYNLIDIQNPSFFSLEVQTNENLKEEVDDFLEVEDQWNKPVDDTGCLSLKYEEEKIPSFLLQSYREGDFSELLNLNNISTILNEEILEERFWPDESNDFFRI